MVEGIAAYVSMVGRPIIEYDRLESVRRAVHQPQTLTTGDQKTAANYGIWFLQLRWLADTYGEEAMLEFFGTAVHEGHLIDEAANRTFGRSWTELHPSIDAFLRTI